MTRTGKYYHRHFMAQSSKFPGIQHQCLFYTGKLERFEISQVSDFYLLNAAIPYRELIALLIQLLPVS